MNKEIEIFELNGIVIKQTDVKDSDLFITVLLEQGIASVLVRGVKKVNSKYRNLVNLYSVVKLEVTKADDIYILKDGDLVSFYPEIYESIKKISLLNLFTEFTTISLDVTDETPFKYFLIVLKAISENFDLLSLCAIYLAQLSKLAGIGIETSECIICGNKTSLISLNFDEGGFICQDCAKESHLSPTNIELMKVARYCYMVKPEQITNAVLPKASITKFIDLLISHYENSFYHINEKLIRFLKNEIY